MRSEIHVELLGHYGGDVEHACSAWTSTSRELTEEKRARIPAMLKQLAEAGHHTPFEKSALHFLVRCDKATHIHLIKHRIGVSVNAESARYKELREDDWHYPDDWPDDEMLRRAYDDHMHSAFARYHFLVSRLEQLGVSRKRTKESARFVLPHAAMVTQDVMFNFRSFMHFLKLRADAHAQREVRVVAAKMIRAAILTTAFEQSLEAFGWGSERRHALYREVGL